MPTQPIKLPLRLSASFLEDSNGYVICEYWQEDDDAMKFIVRACNSHEALKSIAQGVLTALQYPRGSEAQVRCLDEIGQDAALALAEKDL